MLNTCKHNCASYVRGNIKMALKLLNRVYCQVTIITLEE